MSRNKYSIESIVHLYTEWNSTSSAYRNLFSVIFVILFAMLVYFISNMNLFERPTKLDNPKTVLESYFTESLGVLLDPTYKQQGMVRATRQIKNITGQKKCLGGRDCIYLDEYYQLYANYKAQQIDFTYTVTHNLENVQQDNRIFNGIAIAIWSKNNLRWDVYGAKFDEVGEKSYKRKFRGIKK